MSKSKGIMSHTTLEVIKIPVVLDGDLAVSLLNILAFCHEHDFIERGHGGELCIVTEMTRARVKRACPGAAMDNFPALRRAMAVAMGGYDSHGYNHGVRPRLARRV